ncbi:uncharacterized protein [Drosophila bipectinata]|uniref:uncharacterized protein isoform X1 n=2 Tax=Drosophila bipectinata TaxID=42026 RepID=UPI0038B3A9ED
MTCIVDLTNECLLQIVGYLDLKDQLNLKQATDSATRLSSMVAYAWRLQKKFHVYKEFEKRHDLLEDFLKCICSSVTGLILNQLPKEQFDLWGNNVFPNMRELEYRGDILKRWDDDQDCELLVNAFPRLESVSLSGNNFGKHISRWENLRRLDLSRNGKLKLQFLKEICKKLRLQSLKLSIYYTAGNNDAYVQPISTLNDLEELEITLDYLSQEKIAQLLMLPKLRKFCINNLDNPYFWSVIHRVRGEDVLAVTLYDDDWRSSSETLKMFPNLRSLTIIDDNYFDHSELRKFNNVWPEIEGMWKVIAACHQLADIKLSELALKEELLAFNMDTIKRILDARKTPLVVHMGQTGFFGKTDYISLSEKIEHPKLKLHFHPWNYKSIESAEGYIVELVPLASKKIIRLNNK